MAGFNGRNLTIDWNATTLVGVRSRGVTTSIEYVDVTTDDDDGEATYLLEPGKRSHEYTVSGITSDEVLLAEVHTAMGSITGEALKVNLPSSLTTPGNTTGTGLITSFEITGEHDGAYEFSATFIITGGVTYTASV